MPKLPIGNNPANSANTLARNTLNRAQAKQSSDVPVTEDMAKALGIPSNRPARGRVAARDPFPNLDRSASRPKWSK